MANTGNIGISYLKDLPHLTGFLSQNLGFTQRVGKDSDDEARLINSFQKDIAFYKRKYSYQKAKTPTNFNITSIMGAFNTPIKGPNYKKKSINSETSFHTASKAVNKKNSGKSNDHLQSAFLSLKEIYTTVKRHNDEKRYKRNINLKTASFLSPKPNTVKNLKTDSSLSFKRKNISNRENIREDIGRKAYNIFQGQSDFRVENLRKRVEESLFLILNIGDIINVLGTSKKAMKSFQEGTLFSKEALKENIALETLNRLGKQNTINKEFFTENIEAAAYLLDNKTVQNEIMESVATLKGFIDTFGENSSTYISYVVNKANDLLSRNKFSTTFLENNVDFSSLIVGSEHTDNPYSLSAYLNANPRLTEEDFDLNKIIFQYQTATIKESLPPGVSLSENFFSKQKGILNTALNDQNFTQNLINNIDIIERFFSSPEGTLESDDIDKVSESYLSGLSERQE